MKTLAIILLFCIFSSKCHAAVDVAYFPQIIDHDDNTSTTTFQQKYFINADYFNKTNNNLVFLILGGNGGDHDYYVDTHDLLTSGLWAEIGQKAGALMFFLEHRFYGESQPFANTSTEYLQKYLTVEQTMADIANFAYGINGGWGLASDTKWVVFGVGYGGTIATFLRMYFNFIINYAVVSGGAVKAQLAFDDYWTSVSDVIGVHSEACQSYIQSGLDDLDDALSAGTSLDSINSAFNLCDDLNSTLIQDANQVPSFFAKLNEALAYAVKFDKIDSVCELIVSAEGSNITRLATGINHITTIKGDKSCLDYEYNKIVQELSTVSGNFDTSYRPWFFQQCNEFGFFPITTTTNIFKNKNPLDYYVQLCQAVFGSSFTLSYIQSQVQQTIYNYGGGSSTYFGASNVLFVYGSEDPWTKLGHLATNEVTNKLILIEGTAHGTELAASSTSDSAELAAAKQNITSHILNWFES